MIMQELPRLEIHYPSDIIEDAITCSYNDRIETFGNTALAQIAISCQYVEMDTFLDSLAEDYPELVTVFNRFIPTSMRSWMFDDGSIIVYKHGKLTLWQM
jgi:hypothetical protein